MPFLFEIGFRRQRVNKNYFLKHDFVRVIVEEEFFYSLAEFILTDFFISMREQIVA